MEELIERLYKKIEDLEKKIETYYHMLVVDNELDFILKGGYILEDDIDEILDGSYEIDE